MGLAGYHCKCIQQTQFLTESDFIALSKTNFIVFALHPQWKTFANWDMNNSNSQPSPTKQGRLIIIQ